VAFADRRAERFAEGYPLSELILHRYLMNLKDSIHSGDLTLAPGIFDMMSLLIADRKGFSALFLSGYWGMASHLGLPDAGLATYTDFIEQIRKICRAAKTPLIADADTGFGGLLNLDHTVRSYEEAGVAAMQLEDQVSPKRCGHQPGKQVVATEEMVIRIKVAVDARMSDDFLILARTDALAIEGVDSAITRGQAYRQAGYLLKLRKMKMRCGEFATKFLARK